MSSLLKWQTVSFLSRFFAMGVGLVQSVVVARVLTTAEYGLVGIVTAVGGVVGVVRHLGLVSATTRELAGVDDDRQAAKIFFSSLLIRLIVAVPLSIGLFFLAKKLAFETYGHSETFLPLRIFSVVLLLQSVQEICNAVLAGRQKFAVLFSFQALAALASIALFIPLVTAWGFEGYFWAMLAHTVFSALILGFLGLRSLGWQLSLPSKNEFKKMSTSLLRLGLAIYVGKVLYILWQKMGTLYLGVSVSPEEVGVFSFAILYAMKLLVVSDAVTDVNLPAMTNHLRQGFDGFRDKFLANFEKVYALMLLAGVSAVFWSQDIFRLLVGTKYDASLVLIPPLMLAVFIYGLLNLLGSSVLVPAKFLKEMVVYNLVLLAATALVLVLFFSTNPLAVVSWSMALGGLVSLAYLSFVCQRKAIVLWGKRTILPTLAVAPIILAHFSVGDFWLRGGFFLCFLAFYLWLVPKLGILSWGRFLRSR